MHHEVQAAINRKSEHALKVMLFSMWMISTGKARKKLEQMILGHTLKHHKKKRDGKKRKRGHKHDGKHYRKKSKLSKSAARARFKRLLPKINAGRKRAGLPPIRIK